MTCAADSGLPLGAAASPLCGEREKTLRGPAVFCRTPLLLQEDDRRFAGTDFSAAAGDHRRKYLFSDTDFCMDSTINRRSHPHRLHTVYTQAEDPWESRWLWEENPR